MLPDLAPELDALKAGGLYRRLRRVDRPDGARATVDGAPRVVFCSNDYLGLSGHPLLIERACEAARRHGVGSGASRLVSGNLLCHESLEARAAAFLGTEAALSFPTGYAANLGAVTALAGEGDAIFSDRLNHRSLIDACRLSRARTFVYDHKDADHLARLLAEAADFRRRLILTDGVFSMDGDLADLPALSFLAERHRAILLVDDAHGTGVLGESGKGTPSHFGIRQGVDVLTTSASKALGTFGGFVAGRADLIGLLINRAAAFIFTSALPPDVCAATEAAFDVVEAEPERRTRLARTTVRVREALRAMGFDTMASETQIIPVLLGGAERAMAVSEHLFEAGVYATAIRPPTVPKGRSRLRIALSSAHTDDDLDALLAAMASVRERR